MSRPSIREHPEYPYRPGWEDRFDDCDQTFLNPPLKGSGTSELLCEFVLLTHRFAFLERLVQGDVLYELPVHRKPESTRADPDAEGEHLAIAERDLLNWIDTDAFALSEILDEMGIKVLPLEGMPEEDAPAKTEPEDELHGAFFYEGKTGPALFVGIQLDRPEAAFVLAHEFAHLVADINPYRPRFCRWHAETLENLSATPEERRADRFARALLLPEVRLREALAQLGPGPSECAAADPRAEQLAVLFDVPQPLLRHRLHDLRMPDLGSSATPDTPAPHAPGPTGPPASGPGPRSEGSLLSLPKRYVFLALAIYCRQLMGIEELALFLRTTPQGAQQMIDWAQIPCDVDIPEEDA